jgi:hypothetical protein
VCYESCIIDEGTPLDIALQEGVSNRLKPLCLRGMVVSVEETAFVKCQVWDKETSASEPLMRCRKPFPDVVKTGDQAVPRDQSRRNLPTDLMATGIKVA